MGTCCPTDTFIERPDEDKRRRLLWGSMAASVALVAKTKHMIGNRILDRATILYENGSDVDAAIAQATDEVAITL